MNSRGRKTPNQALQQTGHATQGSARHDASFRVSRLLSLVFGEDDGGIGMAWDGDIRVRFPDWGTDAALARWPTIKARLAVGQAVRGEVIACAPFGVWVGIRAGHPALLLVPEMAGARERPIRFEEYPGLGVVVEARIVALGDRAEISLTQNPLFAAGEGSDAEQVAAADRPRE